MDQHGHHHAQGDHHQGGDHEEDHRQKQVVPWRTVRPRASVWVRGQNNRQNTQNCQTAFALQKVVGVQKNCEYNQHCPLQHYHLQNYHCRCRPTAFAFHEDLGVSGFSAQNCSRQIAFQKVVGALQASILHLG